MEVIADKRFEHDFKKLPDNIKRLTAKIYMKLVGARNLSDMVFIKKLNGHKNYHRIKIDHYRLGFYTIKNTIYLSRILARKDMYKFFPLK